MVALSGLLVADFSRVLAGPLATMILADLGADVVKVERPGHGDDTRTWGPPWAGEDSTYYLSVNRNKRSVTLDLADEADLGLARRLAQRADVVVENFRPGTMGRLGLGFESLAEANPGVVLASVSGFGGQGPAAELPGYDFLVQAVSGLMSITGEAGGQPVKVGVAVVDVMCGLYTAIGILAALAARERTGRGQHVEVSLLDTALAGLVNQASAYLNADVVPTAMGNLHPSITPYQSFTASDRPFALAVGSDGLWARTCSALGLEHLVDDPRFATNAERVAHRDAVEAELAAVFATDTAEAWVARLRTAGVPVGPVNDIARAFAQAADWGLDPVVTQPSGDGVRRSTRSPLGLSETPVVNRRPPPRLGEHDEEVRAWLTEPTPTAS